MEIDQLKLFVVAIQSALKKYHRQRDLYKLLCHIIETVLRAINI